MGTVLNKKMKQVLDVIDLYSRTERKESTGGGYPSHLKSKYILNAHIFLVWLRAGWIP